ncbi:type VI secretion system baseplate subunit TssF [Pseudoalteromonas denitrificans]|uniref:Type VI secretion system protein ImpG n=1 Tax=Pseudoalteromonas denitrificans DSM 6059 TaxID=1123010 RepID=A0A1I1GL59_9GAMM|nr:type VI secretion system baseplate subunit TssF [Pseudoalteromonas denitrificans]SFC12509.1 type VI secretion system protein ImpG [Pseudoalteromonas denitrificans DSM 6059]
MSDLLNRYFERELSLIRRSASEFKTKHAGVANTMHLNEKRYEDPNITRLLESVALLSAKNEMKLDQQLPHISNALCSVLYPSFNQLLPSAMSVKLKADTDSFVETIKIPRGEALKVKNETGQLCQFKFCNDVVFSPLSLNSVSARYAPFPFDLPIKHDANSVIQLKINTNDPEGLISQSVPDILGLYLHGFGQGAAGLIALLLSQLKFIAISDTDFKQLTLLDKTQFKPRCIEPEFTVLDKKGVEFTAYQMMLEYFNYSEKRKYFQLEGLNKAVKSIDSNEMVISFFVKDIPSEFIGLFDTSVFQLNTALVINQFTNRAEPIYYNHQQLSVPLNPDASNQASNIEIISVKSVKEVKPDGEYLLQPLFAKRYFDKNNGLLWFSETHINRNKKFQHHLSISFDPNSQHEINHAKEHLLTTDLLCCNGRTPCSINTGSTLKFSGAIELPGELVSHNVPTVPFYPNESQQLHWKLIELLSTNFSALTNVEEPTEKLRNLLSVFSRSTQQQVLTSAIQKVSYQQKVARMYIDGVNIFTSGTLIQIEMAVFDKKNAMNIWLFIHLLNEFFAGFCSFDRFIELEVTLSTDKGKEYINFDKIHGAQRCL